MKLIFAFVSLIILANIYTSLGQIESEPIKTLVIGHRGANDIAPENTFPSFKIAVQLKADGIETDIRITKDDVLILMHDSNVHRTTNGTGEIADLTWDYIKNLDAGSWFGKSFVDTRVPLLDEFFAYVDRVIAQNPNFLVVLDIKVPKVAAPIRALVNKYPGIINNIFLSIWSIDGLSDFVNKSFKLNMWTGDQPSTSTWKKEGFFDEQKQSGIYGYSINQKTISKAFVAAGQAASMPVFLWTPITTHEMRSAVDLGVNGVIVNDIEKMKNIIGG